MVDQIKQKGGSELKDEEVVSGIKNRDEKMINSVITK